MRLSNVKDKKGYLTLFTALAILFIVMLSALSGIFRGRSIHTGFGELPISGVIGCIQVVNFLLCVLMVFIDYVNGAKRAYLCIVLMLVGGMASIIVSKQVGNLPGVINCLLQIFTIYLIKKQFEINEKAAVVDSITGLSNRYGFERIIERMVWLKEKEYLVYLHLDGVVTINSKHGRSCGDELLKIVADRLKDTVGDNGQVFKIEGAEYTIILKSDCDYQDVIKRVIEAVEQKIILHEDNVLVNSYLTVNIGLVDNTELIYDAKNLMKNADTAMNYAIQDSKSKFCIYNDSIKSKVERRMEVENLIKEGLHNDYFYLVYQPQYFANSKDLRGFETLIRMKLPDGRIISPGEFIPIAENSNLCLDIDKYVLSRALREFKDYIETNGNSRMLSVNVSAKGISLPGFAKKVTDIIDEVGFNANCLEIEITEYSLVDSIDQTLENINLLRERGVKIALDDFGSGYTSLSEVLKLPVDLIKIDKSLIDNVKEDETNRDFVKTVIYLGHIMKCEVISEGVEDLEQLEIIKKYNCDLVQGYVWGKPLEYDKALELLK